MSLSHERQNLLHQGPGRRHVGPGGEHTVESDGDAVVGVAGSGTRVDAVRHHLDAGPGDERAQMVGVALRDHHDSVESGVVTAFVSWDEEALVGLDQVSPPRCRSHPVSQTPGVDGCVDNRQALRVARQRRRAPAEEMHHIGTRRQVLSEPLPQFATEDQGHLEGLAHPPAGEPTAHVATQPSPGIAHHFGRQSGDLGAGGWFVLAGIPSCGE